MLWYNIIYPIVMSCHVMSCYAIPVTSSQPKIPEQGLHVVEHISVMFVHWLVDVEHYEFPRNPSILLYNEKIEKLICRAKQL